MASNSTVTVTTDPTLLYQSLGPQQESIIIDVSAGGPITIGGRDVADGAGPSLALDAQPLTLTINEDEIYAIVATGTATVQVAAWISGPNT